MEQLKNYIEREANKNWNKYITFLNDDLNKKDLEQILIYMYEDILPENILKSDKSLLQVASKSEKIHILEHPESFLSKYVQDIFKREKNIDDLVIRSIIKSFKGFKENLEKKKKECQLHMKNIVQFFIELKKSERIILTNKTLELSFKDKSVLTTKFLNPYELGEIFGRYLLAHMFDKSSNTSDFYKNIYDKIQNKDYHEWHILLKYGIFLFIMIEQLFKKENSTYSSLFNVKLMKKFLSELCVLKYGKEEGKKEGKKDKKKEGKKGDHHKKDDRKQFHFQRGGDSIKDAHKKLLEKIKKEGKKKKEGEKKKYEERNKFITFYNKILKETKIYNVYPGKEKVNDTLYSIFLENNDLKNKIESYYDDLIFQNTSNGYCEVSDDQGVQKCDFKKKVPIIFAEQNPDAYFSIENDLFADKTGPKKEYLTRGTKKEDKIQILNTLKEKLTVYKAYYVYDDKYFNEFVKDLKVFQLNLIYLMYMIYLKKYNLYKIFGNILDSILEESINEENINKNNLNMNKNSNEDQNRSTNKQNVINMILTKKYNHLPQNKKDKLDLIYNQLQKISTLKDKIMKNEFGTPEYDDKIRKIDKFIQLLRFEAQKVLE